MFPKFGEFKNNFSKNEIFKKMVNAKKMLGEIHSFGISKQKWKKMSSFSNTFGAVFNSMTCRRMNCQTSILASHWLLGKCLKIAGCQRISRISPEIPGTISRKLHGRFPKKFLGISRANSQAHSRATSQEFPGQFPRNFPGISMGNFP